MMIGRPTARAVKGALTGRPASQPGAACRRTGRRPRYGITLLEVLIALAIFLGALAVIGQIVSTGSQAAVSAQLKAESVRRCETILAEVLSGSIPLQTASGSFEDDPEWSWTVSVQDGLATDLLTIEASVSRNGNSASEYSLTRWVRDPQVFLQTTIDTSPGGSR